MVKFQQQIAGLKFDPSYRWIHSMQPGSSDAGKAASLLLRLGQAKYATGDFEGTLGDVAQADRFNSENSAITRRMCHSIKQKMQDAASSKEARLLTSEDGADQDTTTVVELELHTAKLICQVKHFKGTAADLTTAEHLQPCDVAHLQLHGRGKMELCDYSSAAEDLSNTADCAELLELRGIARFCIGQTKDAFADIARADSLDSGLANKFSEMLEKTFEKYGDPAEEYMAGQIAALKFEAMLNDTHNA